MSQTNYHNNSFSQDVQTYNSLNQNANARPTSFQPNQTSTINKN